MKCRSDIEYFKVHVGGKNALDFQLSTLLGYIVARGEHSHAFIISNDRGFDFLHDFWHGNYVEGISTVVYRTRTISQALSYAQGSAAQAKTERPEEETPEETPAPKQGRGRNRRRRNKPAAPKADAPQAPAKKEPQQKADAPSAEAKLRHRHNRRRRHRPSGNAKE